MELKFELQQRPLLCAAMQQGLRILSLPYAELTQLVEKELEENPLLEVEDTAFFARRAEDRSHSVRAELSYSDALGEPSTGLSLREHLLSQIPQSGITSADYEIILQLTTYIDEKTGLLPYEDMLEQTGSSKPAADVQRCLTLLRGLEPAGVCERDIPHSLCRQLEVKGELTDSARKIVLQFLPLVASGHFGVIARNVGITTAEVRRIVDRIRACHPYPAEHFFAEIPIYIDPDLIFAKSECGWSVEIYSGWLSALRVSALYEKYCSEAADHETQEYLREQIARARQMMQFVQQRRRTLERIANDILEQQQDFFEQRASLRPVRMLDLAKRLGMHSSTVSRAVQGKYAQTPFGVMSLRDFFSAAVGAGQSCISTRELKERIMQLINAECASRPLSDAQISMLLQQDGIDIARRTIAKYRIALHIPNSAARRRD